jgi:hypothetical protein
MKRALAFLIVGLYTGPAVVGNMLILVVLLPCLVLSNLGEWAREVARGGNETYCEIWRSNWEYSLAASIIDNITLPIW